MLKTATLGFPRIGANRELKKAVESYWKKSSSQIDLQKTASEIRKANWQAQKNAGISFIPANDFSNFTCSFLQIDLRGGFFPVTFYSFF